MADALERLKVLIDSSTPIVVMETIEEVRAVRMVRIACSAQSPAWNSGPPGRASRVSAVEKSGKIESWAHD